MKQHFLTCPNQQNIKVLTKVQVVEEICRLSVAECKVVEPIPGKCGKPWLMEEVFVILHAPC